LETRRKGLQVELSSGLIEEEVWKTVRRTPLE
jgi:hypothetical protein